MNPRQSLGASAKRRREALGLSQVQLAERMGGSVKQSDISRIERGHLPWPRFDLLRALASGLNLTALELITLSGWMSPSELKAYQQQGVAAAQEPPQR